MLTGLSKEETEKKIEENLVALTQRPQDVMALMSDLKMFQVSSVWADFMT